MLRNHETEKPFMGPRFLVRAAGLEMHPIDQADRREYLKDSGGIGYCNITKCCTEVCPEHIKITDNAIIPLKERVADEYYDPIQWAWRKLRGEAATCRAPRRRAAGARRGRRRRPSPDAEAAAGSPAGAGSTERRCPELDDDPASDARPRRSLARLRHPHRRRGARQPRPASLGRGALRPRRARMRATHRAQPDASISDYLGVQTNNVAEYTGVVRALALAPELGAREVDLLLDSKLIVEQLAGRWRVKDAKLLPLWASLPPVLAGFERWTAAHVPRAQNSVADALANEAIDRVGPAAAASRPRRGRAGSTSTPGPSGSDSGGQRGGRMAARRRGNPSA